MNLYTNINTNINKQSSAQRQDSPSSEGVTSPLVNTDAYFAAHPVPSSLLILLQHKSVNSPRLNINNIGSGLIASLFLNLDLCGSDVLRKRLESGKKRF